jgi:hypothetical protein
MRSVFWVLGRAEAASDPDEAIGYGYPQAIRHGFALAGLSNKIFENCSYRDPADRIAFIDRLRASMIAERHRSHCHVFSLLPRTPALRPYERRHRCAHTKRQGEAGSNPVR